MEKKRMLKEKKAIMAFNFLAMMPRLIFLVIMLVTCVVLISLFLNNKFDVLDTQAEVAINGFMYGAGGVGYFDPLTGRTYPQIIDETQLDSGEIDIGFFFPENRVLTAKVSLQRKLGEEGETGTYVTQKKAYYNKQWYDNWEPLLALKHLPGIGGVTDTEKRLPILMRGEDGELRNAYIHFQVVQPKSLRKSSKKSGG